jgi:hypothetical protein
MALRDGVDDSCPSRDGMAAGAHRQRGFTAVSLSRTPQSRASHVAIPAKDVGMIHLEHQDRSTNRP